MASDKHMEKAQKIVSFAFGREGYRYSALAVDIAAALSNAEREGMKRAAEIIRDGVDRPVSVSFRMDGKPSKNDKCPHDFYVYEDCEECCVAAILSEAKESE